MTNAYELIKKYIAQFRKSAEQETQKQEQAKKQINHLKEMVLKVKQKHARKA